SPRADREMVRRRSCPREADSKDRLAKVTATSPHKLTRAGTASSTGTRAAGPGGPLPGRGRMASREKSSGPFFAKLAGAGVPPGLFAAPSDRAPGTPTLSRGTAVKEFWHFG